MKKWRFRLKCELHLTRQWRTAKSFSFVEFPNGSGIKWMRIELSTGEVMITDPSNIDIILEKNSHNEDDD